MLPFSFGVLNIQTLCIVLYGKFFCLTRKSVKLTSTKVSYGKGREWPSFIQNIQIKSIHLISPSVSSQLCVEIVYIGMLLSN